MLKCSIQALESGSSHEVIDQVEEEDIRTYGEKDLFLRDAQARPIEIGNSSSAEKLLSLLSSQPRCCNTLSTCIH